MTHTILIDRPERHDPRLGRIVQHDSRSRMFAYQADEVSYVNAQHTSAVPVFDQGNVGSCTGNAAVKCLSYGDLWAGDIKDRLSTTNAGADEDLAKIVYSDAENLDGDGPYPPNDNGSSGLSVAKVLQTRNWISGYQHAFSLSATLTALSRQAVIVGTNWYTDMFNPSSADELVIGGKVEGGHEYVLDQIDVDKERVGMQNSWGSGWGQSGRAWMSFATLSRLLSEGGDCTIFTPITAPAPTPQPVPTPAPVPAPGDPQATFVLQAEAWIALRHSSAPNVQMEKDTQAYLDWLKTQ